MFSKWSSINKLKELPNKEDVAQIQYRHYFNWNGELNWSGIAAQIRKADWHIQVVEPSGRISLEQKVQIDIVLVSLGSLGLQFFTWAIQKETIETLIIGGTEISTENPAWSHTIGGQPTSEFGTMIPGGGSDYTNRSFTITGFWESPVYKIDVPPGSKLRVIKDSWGLGAVTRPEWQFRFLYGNQVRVDVTEGVFEELQAIHTITGGRTLFHEIRTSDDVVQPRGYLNEGSSPSLCVYPNGRMVVGVLESKGYFEYESLDMGLSFSPVEYIDPETLDGVIQPLFGPEVRMPQAVIVEKDRVLLGVRGNKLLLRSVSEENVGAIQTLPQLAQSLSYSLVARKNGKVQIMDSVGRIVYETVDSALSYQPVPQEDNVEEPEETP